MAHNHRDPRESDQGASEFASERATETTPRNPKGDSWRLYRRLLSYLYPHRYVFALSILGYMVFAASSPAVGLWLGWTLDAVSAQDYESARILSPILCIAIVVIRGLGGFAGGYSMSYVANHVVHRLRSQIMDHLLRLPIPYFDKNTSGRLVSKVTYDVTQVTGAATNALTVLIREGLTVIGLLIALLLIDWQLSLAFLFIAPMVGKIVSVASRRFRKYSTQMQDSMGDVTQFTSESIKGHRVVRTFNARDFVNNRFVRASDRNRRQNMKMAITQSISTPFIQLLVSIAMAGLIWMAMSPEFFVDKTPGDFVAFLTMAGLLAKPIRQLSQVNSVIQRGVSASDSIFTLLDERIELDEGTFEVNRAQGRVEFKQVTFAYGKETRALLDINFVVEPGQTIALVGKSGSGKSTLVSLIPRFYESSLGSILLDGVKLQDYKLENLRQQISLVTQQVVLFNGTIEENIAYGIGNKFDHSAIKLAARNAHALEFIDKLSDGMATEIGDDAILLSGGQRQRIAIARALLKDAPILILDEATSALDSESEHHIQLALRTLMQGRTTFVIAHRLSTIESADQILVMDDGKISESGTHQQLLAAGGHYARLHKMQFSDQVMVESG